MKKPQANFVVEYKSARRKEQPKSNSIWGDVDLRSYADEGGSPKDHDGPSGSQAAPIQQSLPGGLSLTSTKSGNVQGTERSRVNSADRHCDSNVSATVRTETLAQSDRIGPLIEKATHEDDLGAPSLGNVAPAANPPERTSGKAAGKTKPARQSERISKNTSPKRAPDVLTGLDEYRAAGDDEMEDLLQLEQENSELRRLLVEKLRSDNAFLRKRLGLD